MKQVLFKKKIVVVVGKLTRSKVLWSGAEFYRALWGKDGARQNHVGRGRRSHPLTSPYPIVIPNCRYQLICLSPVKSPISHSLSVNNGLNFHPLNWISSSTELSTNSTRVNPWTHLVMILLISIQINKNKSQQEPKWIYWTTRKLTFIKINTNRTFKW